LVSVVPEKSLILELIALTLVAIVPPVKALSA
jgi:hypothetical protein